MMRSFLYNAPRAVHRRGRGTHWMPWAIQAGAVFLLAGCGHKDGGAPAMPARPPAIVSAAAATMEDVPVYLDEIGKIVAVEFVAIVPQVGGKITHAHVEDGAYVKKGQLLFEIDPRPYEAALAMAEATLAQNKALLELTRAEFNRVRDLEASAVSRVEYDQKKNAVAVAEARVAGGEASVASAKLDLEYTRIYSPLDGRAGARLTHPGNVVRANDAPLLMIQRLDPIYAEFTITENDLGTVRRFMGAAGVDLAQANSRLKVEVDVPADSVRILSTVADFGPASRPGTQPATRPASPREGTLTFLDNTVQSGAGTVKLRATVPNADGFFWPGQFVRVRLVLTTRKNAVLIPAAAEQIGQHGPYVYVVRPNSTAELRPIRPGQMHGDRRVVEQGLQPGEKVVVAGHMLVMPDAPLVVLGGGGPPGMLPPAATMPGASPKP